MAEIEFKAYDISKTTKGDHRDAHQSTLSISVLGNMSAAHDGRTVKIKSRKSRAVLAFLALSESRQETRERLVGLFWSESEEHKARASLRQTLHELRQALLEVGYNGLQTEKLTIELDPRRLEVDLWAAINAAERQSAHPLVLNVPRVAESLLVGFEDIDPEFRMWLLAKRQTFQERLLRGLESGLVGNSSDARNRKRLAEAIINLDPTHEEACRWLMRLRAEGGDVAGALHVYKALWDRLDEDYDTEPSIKTQELVAQIKVGEFDGGARSATPVAAPSVQVPEALRSATGDNAIVKPTTKVALLFTAFGMNGVGADKIHLVHGFRHHLIACLIRFREWSVADGVVQSAIDGQTQSFAARYVVDATAYQTGQAVSLVLTLRESSTNVYIWSEAFELKVESWFEAQQRIVRRIASSLNVQLSAERLKQLAGEPDVSLEVYDRWLRGQALILKFSPDNWDRAAQIFADGIRDAPNFSSCYSSLVQMNNAVHFVHPGVFRDFAKARHTLELGRTAVQLDPVDSRAQLCLGWAYAMSKQYVQAEVHMDLARELNENDSWTLTSTALFNAFCGGFDQARKLASEALEPKIAPTPTQWAYQAMIRFLCGDYAGVIEATDRANDAIKTMPAWRAAALFYLGREDESHHERRRFLNLVRSNWFGSEPASDEVIGRWFLHCHPISMPEHWERLCDGARGAGIPVIGIKHHDW